MRSPASKGGSVEFRVEKAGIVHAAVGKVSFTAEKLAENIKAFADSVCEGEAGRRQGHLYPARRDLVDHGSGRQDRAEHGSRRLIAMTLELRRPALAEASQPHHAGRA